MYYLTENKTPRALPGHATGLRLMAYARRRDGESIGFDNGGDTALLLDANGRTLAAWQFDQRGVA
jgi:hypothetical protein